MAISVSERATRNLPAVGAAVRNIVILIAVVSIPLTAAQALGLTEAETSSLLLALFGVPALLSFILIPIYRQPLLLTGNLFVVIYINGLGGAVSYPELIGASLLAGVAVLAIALLGLSKWLARLVPVPIMFGLLAGAVMPFVSRLFSVLGQAPVVVGGTLLVYLISRGLLGKRMPAILPALIAGTALAAATGQFARLAQPLSLTLPKLTLPVFSIPAILSATPVFVVLITLQGNLPSLRFLESQGYEPPHTVIGILSGIGVTLGAFLGPTGVSLSLPATSIVGGEDAGDPAIRHRAAYLVAGAGLLVGVLAGVAAGLSAIVPAVLLYALAGLAVVDILANALEQVTEGPLILGPLFAFAIALSDISFLGFDHYFWSLVIGTAVSLLLERSGLRAFSQRRAEALQCAPTEALQEE